VIRNISTILLSTSPHVALYLTHRTHVNVIDADTFAVVGDIPGLHQAHGVALVNELGKDSLPMDLAPRC